MKTKFIIENLDVVKPALAKKPLVPLFNHFCFSDKLVKAFNEELFMETACDIDLDIALPGELLYRFLSTIDKNISLIKNKNVVEIATKDKKIINKIQGLETKDFPKIECNKKKLKDSFKITKKFISNLEEIIKFVGEDLMVPHYIGVLVTSKFMYGTDGRIIAKCLSDLKIKNEIFFPKALCLELIRLSEQLDKIEIYENLIKVSGVKTKIIQLISDISFPDCKGSFKSFVDKHKNIKLIDTPFDFSQSINRLCLVGEDLLDKICSVKFSKSSIEFELDNKANSHLKEKFNIKTKFSDDIKMDIKSFEKCVSNTVKFTLLDGDTKVLYFENEKNLQVIMAVLS